MNALLLIAIYLLVCAVDFLSNFRVSFAQAAKGMQARARDGQQYFDFLFGLEIPPRTPPDSTQQIQDWVECYGIDVVRKVWDGRANFDELELDGLRATSKV